MGFFTALYLTFLLAGLAMILAKAAARHPETTGGIAKALVRFFAKK